MTEYQCQGIGKNSTCGAQATTSVKSNKWNAVKEEIEEIFVHLCARHAEELRMTMEEKFKTGRIVPKSQPLENRS